MTGLRSALVLALMTAVSPVQARQAAAVNPQALRRRGRGLSNGRPLTEAVTTLQPWARKDFEAAVDRLIAARNISQLEAAAVFELESASAVMAVSPDGAQIHYELGEKMLRSLAPTREELRLDPGRAGECPAPVGHVVGRRRQRIPVGHRHQAGPAVDSQGAAIGAALVRAQHAQGRRARD